MKVYLDHAATAPVKKEVLAAMLPYLTNYFGNPSSLHSWGQMARQGVDEARQTIAQFLGSPEKEIIFTSGGTEADNLAVRGMIDFGQKNLPHIVTSQIEHHAVLRSCQNLEKNGLAKVTYLKPNRDGLIEVEKVQKALQKNTVLVSIMYVNNEIGTVQPIRDLGKMLEKENKTRAQKVYFHTDAVQATAYQKMNVDYLHVDLLTMSGHKIGAPKGVGVLFVREKTPFRPIIFGGEQERNFRAGTENVAGIVAIAKAVSSIRNKELSIKKITKLRDYFIDQIQKEITEVELNGSAKMRNPNNVNFYFKYIEGESILLNLDLVGIAASSGSACTSQSLEPSHVLVAVYNDPQRAHGSIRFTLGENTTVKEIDYTVAKLKIIVQKLRDMSPLYEKL